MLIVYSAIAELSPLRLYAAAMFPPFVSWFIHRLCYLRVRSTKLAPKPRDEDVPSVSKIYFDLLVSFSLTALDSSCPRLNSRGVGNASRSCSYGRFRWVSFGDFI